MARQELETGSSYGLFVVFDHGHYEPPFELRRDAQQGNIYAARGALLVFMRQDEDAVNLILQTTDDLPRRPEHPADLEFHAITGEIWVDEVGHGTRDASFHVAPGPYIVRALWGPQPSDRDDVADLMLTFTPTSGPSS